MNIHILHDSMTDKFQQDINGNSIYNGDILVPFRFYEDLKNNFECFFPKLPSIYVANYFMSLDNTLELYYRGNCQFECCQAMSTATASHYIKIALDDLSRINIIYNKEKEYYSDVTLVCNNSSYKENHSKGISFKKTSYYYKLMKIIKNIKHQKQWIKKYNTYPFIYYNYGKNISYQGEYNLLSKDKSFTLSDYYRQPLEERDFQIYIKPFRSCHYKEFIYKEKRTKKE